MVSPLFTLFALLLLGVGMSSCGLLGIGETVKWKEEVQLSDGQVIVIERETQHESGGDEWASNRRGTKPKERRFRFAYSEGSTKKRVEWRTTKFDENMWPEKPLILDMEFGQPVVYSIAAISIGCDAYFRYAYNNGSWVETPLPDVFDKHIANLLIREDFDIPSMVTLEVKRKVHKDAVGWRKALQVGPSRKVCG